MKYNPNEIEERWQKYWAENKTFAASNQSDSPKYYVLDMFPYPSGAGLHVGHPLGYIASDIYARYKRHKGFNVLHPMGYDSFGLPAEQYAIQTGNHPEKTTAENILRYRKQLDRIGFSFDWQRVVQTSSPEYYKWTQWIFIQLFESWYNHDTRQAEAITSLIQQFERNGNISVNAACDDDVDTFTAQQWHNFSATHKQLVLLKYRLTYLAETEVNWCPALGTVLANDEIVNGLSERGGHPVVRKKMKQWSMRISAYAERLIDGLFHVDYAPSLKESQLNWIGKSVGASISFEVASAKTGLSACADGEIKAEVTAPVKIEVFTTRPDTLFGVTFLTLAPEHELVRTITTPNQWPEVEAYVALTAKRSERERLADVKTISGVFTGAYALHPFTQQQIPIWIGDYVLAGYGTGAVMAVPSGDERDHAFAKYFSGSPGMPDIKHIFKDIDTHDKAYTDKQGFVLTESGFLDGLSHKYATIKVVSELERIGAGCGKTNYRLRDAVFSRQRYWGEPFPVYYVNDIPNMIPEDCLPMRLPEVEKYLPTEEGLPPLGNAVQWAWDVQKRTVVDKQLIDQKNVYPLELNTMPGWAGSSWYWLRYMDPGNNEAFVSGTAEAYWQNVDLYIGGSEHATGHLLYARFWNKFLFDRGFIGHDEPFKKLINQGMILGTSAFIYCIEGTNSFISKNKITTEKVYPIHVDVNLVNASDELDIEGFRAHPMNKDLLQATFITDDNGCFTVGREVEKMSKSKYNVVTPDAICEEYGADTLRMYEMFLGPLEQAKPWNTAGITGVFGFLKKLWRLYFDDNGLVVNSETPSRDALKTLHKTIKKVQDDIENFSFNTSVSSFMIAVNELTAMNCRERSILEPLAILISPYAPHLAEELWCQLGNQGSIARVPFPVFDPSYLVEHEKEYPVSFNGKTRFTLTLPLDLSKEQIEAAALEDTRTKIQLAGQALKKIIVVPGKIINIVY